MKKRVEFDTHKVVKKLTEVEFTKRDGTDVDFTARKEMKVPVHVRFKANVKYSRRHEREQYRSWISPRSRGLIHRLSTCPNIKLDFQRSSVRYT